MHAIRTGAANNSLANRLRVAHFPIERRGFARQRQHDFTQKRRALPDLERNHLVAAPGLRAWFQLQQAQDPQLRGARKYSKATFTNAFTPVSMCFSPIMNNGE